MGRTTTMMSENPLKFFFDKSILTISLCSSIISYGEHFIDQCPRVIPMWVGALFQRNSNGSVTCPISKITILQIHLITDITSRIAAQTAEAIAELHTNVYPVGYMSTLAIAAGSIVHPIHKYGITKDCVAQVSVCEAGHKVEV